MAVLDLLLELGPLKLLGLAVAGILLIHLVPYYLDPYGLRKYPAPGLAAYTDFWLVYHTRYGRRFAILDEAHKKYGKYVRISPRQVSIADPDALNAVYGHGNGSMKSPFYDAFVGLKNVRGLFNTRDRAEHTRKRKIVSSTFAQKNVLEFESYIREVLRNFLTKWDKYTDQAKKLSQDDGWWVVDILPWLNYLAFDIIGDLAFGAPFGMVEREADVCEIEKEDGSIIHVPAVDILNERGEYSNCLGVMQPWLRPYAKYVDPWFSRGALSVRNLAGMARARVNQRLKTGAGDRKDLLARLQDARDENGQPMGIDELTAEALTQLIAGSDTTSNSSTAILFYLARNTEKQDKLYKELSDAFGPRGLSGVMEFEDVKGLPYLNAVISESLRMHSTSSMGLPRIIAQDTEFKGERFPAGMECSVPAYTVHHMASVWGDPLAFRPERWLGEEGKDLEKNYIPFGIGPRSCVGRNLASMELLVFIATLIYCYELRAKDPKQEALRTSEGFLRKPLEAYLRIRRRAEKA